MSASAPYLSLLNPAQRQAVLHQEGPLLVFAGAGSGKTRVLTYRILHLLKTGAADPREIFAVTFTNKAAQEMKQRVAQLLEQEHCDVWVSTFHSSCVRILRRHATLLGFTPQFVIYNRNDSLAALKRVMKQQNIDPKVISPRSVLSEIDRAKNRYLDPEGLRNARSYAQDDDERVYEIYCGYQEELLRSNAMDFGDLLCNTVSLFSIEPTILAAYQKRFRYILVDEYQDTNHVQYLLIHQLAQASRNLCVVGDDDQSIYAFRGASIENILSFEKDFPDVVRVMLNQNYRSTKTILAAANALIAKNSKRQEKSLITDNPTGEPITCYCADDENDEARFVAEQIVTAEAAGVSLSEIAIFYRTNAQSRAFEEVLSDYALPFRLFGGLRFYERKEVRDLLSYLRLLANPADNESLLRIINTPTRGIGPSSLQKIQRLATSRNTTLLAALREAIQDKTLGSAAQKKCSAFLSLIDELQNELALTLATLATEDAPSTVLSSLLQKIADRSGYLSGLIDEGTDEALARVENLQELFAVAEQFVRNAQTEGNTATIADFLDRSSLVSDLDSENTKEHHEERQRGQVSMMTLHLAKGLEFDYAFLTGLEDGLLPHIRSLDSRAALEEERRLCYVGITRGKKRVFLSRCEDRNSSARGRGWSSGMLSRFIADIPKEGTIDKGGFFSLGWDSGVVW